MSKENRPENGTVFISLAGIIYFYDENCPGNRNSNDEGFFYLSRLTDSSVLDVTPVVLEYWTQLTPEQSKEVLSGYDAHMENVCRSFAERHRH